MKPRADDGVASLLVFGWGNPSRGDDALGPMLIEHLDAWLTTTQLAGIECLTDFQLQVEHALDLAARRQVLFVDASLDCRAPFEVTSLEPAHDSTFTTHAMSPQALMQVFRQIHGVAPPPCTLLAIRGERFALGEPLSDVAQANLATALEWSRHWITTESPLASEIPAPAAR